MPAEPKAGIGPVPSNHPLEAFMQSSLGDVFPAAVLLIQQRGQVLWYRAYGWHDPESRRKPAQPDSLFDLASLTKLFTATAFMRMVEAGKVDLETPVVRVLPAFSGERIIGGTEDPLRLVGLPADPKYAGQRVDLAKITFRHLLTHTSGLAAWRSVYRINGSARGIPAPGEAPEDLRARRLAAVYAYDFAYPTGEKVVYSDLGFILLGEAVEALSGLPLDAAVQCEVGDVLGLERTVFNPLDREIPAENIIPAEICGWRRRRLVGEVDDENAASLGGAAGHAGLFSTAQEVARLGQTYLDRGRWGERRLLSPDTVTEMVREQAHDLYQRRGLAWLLQTPGECSCGKLFGPRSFGHTGFTGTSIWIDPDRELVVVSLTNRVYYGRKSQAIQDFRPALHDLIVQTLVDV